MTVPLILFAVVITVRFGPEGIIARAALLMVVLLASIAYSISNDVAAQKCWRVAHYATILATRGPVPSESETATTTPSSEANGTSELSPGSANVC